MDKNEKDKIVHLKKPNVEKEVPDFYINQVNLVFSQFDVLFNFGLKTDPNADPKELVRVRMSPEHVKVFALLLVKHIKKYEKDIGEIKILPKILQELELDGVM